MTFASVFSGIGVPDLAAQMLGWDIAFQCENDAFCQRVLQYYFPDAELFGDIKTTNFKHYDKTIHIICGGFPCQPFSYSGKRKGKKDDRFLWGEMLRCIREVAPRWVVIENVPGLLTIDNGMVLEQMYADLENAGYETLPPFVIPACAVNAPHRRDRLWIVAHSTDTRSKNMQRKGENGVFEDGLSAHAKKQRPAKQQRKSALADITGNDGQGLTTDTASGNSNLQQCGQSKERPAHSFPNYEQFPTQSPVCNRNDGIACELSGITFPKWRRESIKALGNAIVFPLIYEILCVIDEIEKDDGNAIVPDIGGGTGLEGLKIL
ncbi:hypothetical protein FACS189434_06600 [Bacteroidia bacterium]|nr:hypothetical protein FACS189434_06600 [Bacteroidia bacterium]